MGFSRMIKRNDVELLKKLQSENILLMEENKRLNETVGWMHDTIWRLVRTQRSEN